VKPFAVFILVSAWACLLLAPSGTVSRTLQLLVFLGLGALLSLVGFFSWYWDSNMRPNQQSAFVLVCGLGTLASQIGTVLGMLTDAVDDDFPGGGGRRTDDWRNRR
jgi:hypothetical protein